MMSWHQILNHLVDKPFVGVILTVRVVGGFSKIYDVHPFLCSLGNLHQRGVLIHIFLIQCEKIDDIQHCEDRY